MVCSKRRGEEHYGRMVQSRCECRVLYRPLHGTVPGDMIRD